MKNPDSTLPKSLAGFGDAGAKKPASTSTSKKPPSTSKKPASQAAKKPESKGAKKPVSKAESKSTGKGKSKAESVEKDDVMEDVEEASAGEEDEDQVDEDDLAVINGVKPDVYMKDGDEREIKSMTR